MTRPSKKEHVTDGRALTYNKWHEIAHHCAGYVGSGNTAEVWHGDTEYLFEGEGYTRFLEALKDDMKERLYKSRDFCNYVIGAAQQPPSRFVIDALVAKAQECIKVVEVESWEEVQGE